MAADLSTPDNAAKFGASFLSANTAASDSTKPKAKVVQNCNVSGTTDTVTSGTTTKITYALCRTRANTVLQEQDGVLSTALGAFTGASTQINITLGENNVSLSQELLEPIDTKLKTLLLGTISNNTTLSSSFTPTRSESQLRLSGAVINTKKSTRPRIDFRVGNATTPYSVVVEDLDKPVIKTTLNGPSSVSGACGSGSATVSTTTPLLTTASTGQTTAGVISIQSSSGNATYTYNSDNTVTIAAGGSSKTFTQAQLQSLSSCTEFQ